MHTIRTEDTSALLTRIETLERQNRRAKRAAWTVLVLTVCLVALGQASHTSRTLEAASFVLRDAHGAERAELSMGKDDAALRFFDAKGNQTSVVSDGYVFMYDPQHTNREAGAARAAYIILSTAEGKPAIVVADADGMASLGVNESVVTRTGERQTTSAASLVLIGRDGKALWSAP